MHIKYKFDNNLNVTKTDDILTIITKTPKIILVNKFSEESAKEFRKDFSNALDTGQDIIPIVIDSYGGNIDSLLSMVDIIEASPKSVITFATGKAISCGAVLFTCGEKRYISQHTRVMIHDVAGISLGKISKLKIDTKENSRLNDVVYAIMDKNIGKKKGYISKIVEKRNREDWFLTAKQAKKHNIATHIGVPKFKASISMKMLLK